jgi:hypothetical protein
VTPTVLSAPVEVPRRRGRLRLDHSIRSELGPHSVCVSERRWLRIVALADGAQAPERKVWVDHERVRVVSGHPCHLAYHRQAEMRVLATVDGGSVVKRCTEVLPVGSSSGAATHARRRSKRLSTQ